MFKKMDRDKQDETGWLLWAIILMLLFGVD